MSRSELSDLGSVNYHQFDHAIILDQVMRQAGNNAAVSEYNVVKLHANGQPVAMIKAVHSGPESKQSFCRRCW